MAAEKKHPGVLLVNTGSPDSCEVSDVERYLKEFLGDPRVIDLPWLIRKPLVNWVIAPRRAPHSAEMYRTIWTDQGPPLLALSRKCAAALEKKSKLPVEIAMRYQSPTIASALERLKERGVDEVILVPMFPHFAMSTYETVVQAFLRAFAAQEGKGGLRSYRIVEPWFDRPSYIKALARHIKREARRGFDHIIFTFHSLPESHIRKSDPTGNFCLGSEDCCSDPERKKNGAHNRCYRSQVFETARLVAAEAKIPDEKWSLSFQSAMERGKWLGPSTEERLAELASSGVRRLALVAPGFVTDNLETLEELSIRAREIFLGPEAFSSVVAEQKSFLFISSLNDSPEWIHSLEEMVREAAGA